MKVTRSFGDKKYAHWTLNAGRQSSARYSRKKNREQCVDVFLVAGRRAGARGTNKSLPA